MRVIHSVVEMQEYVSAIKARGETIAFVPTMGYLHRGHLDLMVMGRGAGDHLIISIFVNPTQFGVNEDLDQYPRDFERDMELAADVGVECIFAPDDAEMYPEGYATYVGVEGLTEKLCGRSRPTHFRGVTTVVNKLFNIVKPDFAIFGQKDYQQLVVIRRMVKDLNLDVKILGHPIVREEDGLAMSSRNKYLSIDQREKALVLNRTLKHVKSLCAAGTVATAELKTAAEAMIGSVDGVAIDYIEIVHPDSLEALERIERSAVMAVAVRVGETRLIDNISLEC